MTCAQRLALVGLIAGALLFSTAPARAADGVRAPIEFIVNRDGTPVGTQRLTFRTEPSPGGERLIVDGTIDVKVRVAFITAYRFLLTEHEVWQAGRLIALDTKTDDDGTNYMVRARATAAGLQVDATHAHYLAPPGTLPDSYWPPDTVKHRHFIDIENGKLVDLASTPTGRRTIAVDGKPTEVSLYRLSGVINGELGYGPSGDWVLLRFPSHGSDILYTRAPR